MVLIVLCTQCTNAYYHHLQLPAGAPVVRRVLLASVRAGVRHDAALGYVACACAACGASSLLVGLRVRVRVRARLPA